MPIPPALLSHLALCVCVFVPQSYALYITGDENATSTDVSKYLAKVSAGVSFSDFLKTIVLLLSRDCVCFQ